MSPTYFESMLPGDREDSFDSLWPFPRDDEEVRRPAWKAADVQVYRAALAKLGFSGDALESLIEKDCGMEFSERPFLTRKQA